MHAAERFWVPQGPPKSEQVTPKPLLQYDVLDLCTTLLQPSKLLVVGADMAFAEAYVCWHRTEMTWHATRLS